MLKRDLGRKREARDTRGEENEKISAFRALRSCPKTRLDTPKILGSTEEKYNTVTARKCSQWYWLMQTCIPRCLNGEHIES